MKNGPLPEFGQKSRKSPMAENRKVRLKLIERADTRQHLMVKRQQSRLMGLSPAMHDVPQMIARGSLIFRLAPCNPYCAGKDISSESAA
jgi:hypothetical protein